MIQTPRRSFLTLVFGASICSFVIEVAVAEEPRRDDIEQAIKALSDDSYRNRHDACRALIWG